MFLKKKFLQQIELIKKFGIPNYYDDQRFSSVSKNKVFFAKELILKRYKNALYTILVHSSHKESSKTKKIQRVPKKRNGEISQNVSSYHLYPGKGRSLKPSHQVNSQIQIVKGHYP